MTQKNIGHYIFAVSISGGLVYVYRYTQITYCILRTVLAAFLVLPPWQAKGDAEALQGSQEPDVSWEQAIMKSKGR